MRQNELGKSQGFRLVALNKQIYKVQFSKSISRAENGFPIVIPILYVRKCYPTINYGSLEFTLFTQHDRKTKMIILAILKEIHNFSIAPYLLTVSTVPLSTIGHRRPVTAALAATTSTWWTVAASTWTERRM